jgi:hypothetical protein
MRSGLGAPGFGRILIVTNPNGLPDTRVMQFWSRKEEDDAGVAAPQVRALEM